jgi:glycerol uptake facilitator-like aquaporin
LLLPGRRFGAGSGGKPGEAMPMATLAAVAIAHALAAGVLVTAGFHVSGGHLNPAVTVAMMVRGHLSKLRTVLYVAAQLLASSLACILLRYLTGGMVRAPIHGSTYLFSLCYTILAYACPEDPGKGEENFAFFFDESCGLVSCCRTVIVREVLAGHACLSQMNLGWA